MEASTLVKRLGVLAKLYVLRNDLAIRPDDTFLVSYPKSGNTWARFLVANLLYPDREIDFGNIDVLVPNSEILTRRPMPSPRVLKSHEPFQPSYPRVIYIVRDPRDVVLSSFHFRKKRNAIPDDYSLHSFMIDFLLGRTCAYGSWREHVGSWIGPRWGDADFLLLKYEDLLSDTGRQLAKIAQFLRVPGTAERISMAVDRSSPNRMRQLEATTGDKSPLTRKGRKELPFVRTAKSGNWKTELPEECVHLIEERWGEWMSRMGYAITASRHEEALDGLQFARESVSC